jgi:O-antigen/teichoic acid export membrane protein
MGEDAERLVVGLSYSMLGGMASQSLLYLAGVLVMRLLGPADYGLYQLVFLVPLLVTPVLNFGIESTLVRFVSKYVVDDPEKGIRTARFLFFVRAGVGLLACGAILVLAPWIGALLGEDVVLGVRIAGIFLLGNMLYLFMQFFFQAFFLMKERTAVMTVHGAVYLAVVPVLVYAGAGYLAPIMAFTITKYASVLIGLLLAWRKGLNLIAPPSREGVHLLEQVRFAAPTYVDVLLWAVFTQIGVILIRATGLPVVEIGYFRAVYNVVLVGSFLAMVLNVVVYPYVSELESKGNEARLSSFCSLIIRFLILLGTPASIGFFLVSKPTLQAFLPEYLPALTIMQTLSLMLLFLPLFQVSKTVLLGIGRPKAVAYTTLASTGAVVGLGVVLALVAETEGLAFAYVIATLLGMSLALYTLTRRIEIRISISSIAKVAFSTLAMGAVTYLVMASIASPILQIAIGVATGLVVYGALAYFLKILSENDIDTLRTALGIARHRTLAGRDS